MTFRWATEEQLLNPIPWNIMKSFDEIMIGSWRRFYIPYHGGYRSSSMIYINHCIIFSEIHQPRSQQKVEVDAGYEKATQVKKVGLGTPHFWWVFILTLFDTICFMFHGCSFIGVLKIGSSHAGQANRHGVCGARCFASPAPWSWETHGKTQIWNSKPGFRMISYSIHLTIFFETIQPCLPIVLHFLFRRISEINKSYQVIPENFWVGPAFSTKHKKK